VSDAPSSATVIVRTFNSERTLPTTLAALARQTVRPEIVIVDSGSSDRTLALARPAADRIVELAPEEFSYGRALNRGAEVASGEVHLALSSHCAPSTDDWVERSLGHYARRDVAGTNGRAAAVDRHPPDEVIVQTGADADPFPMFSNHASSWRAAVWRDFPFDEELVASEDAEWSLRVRAAGWVIVFDPALLVPTDHRWQQGPRALYRRIRNETLGTAAFTRVEPLRTRDLVHHWWSAEHHWPGSVPWRQRVSPYRLIELAGRWSAGRELRKRSAHGRG
jgi:glycosyltransferase involved in cell wall biosynthesis